MGEISNKNDSKLNLLLLVSFLKSKKGDCAGDFANDYLIKTYRPLFCLLSKIAVLEDNEFCGRVYC